MSFPTNKREQLQSVAQAVILCAAGGHHTAATDLAQFYLQFAESTFPSDRGVQHPQDTLFLRLFSSLSDDDFRSACRTSWRGFVALVKEIEDCPVFSNDSGNPQVHPAWQIAVALAHFGGGKNGTSKMSRKVLLGLDDRTIQLYTNRVMEALLSVEEYWLFWPSEARRKELGYDMSAEGFPGCVGFVDFTSILLARKPGPNMDGEPYVVGNSRYSIGMTIICDVRERIILFKVDQPGGMSSDYGFNKLDVHQKPELYFSPGEYLLADMAYTVTMHCMPAYKPRASKTPDNKDFNTCVANSNVRSENCIGVLKSRWGSLRLMTLQIKEKKDLRTFEKWVASCCILYNILAELDDPWDDVFLDDEVPGYTGEKALGSKAARDFRENLKRVTLETNRQLGRLK